jgi:PAS domain S-box-containing protein
MAKSSLILRSAVEAAHLGLAELDPEGRFVSVNAPYLSTLGLNECDLLGRHWRATVHPDDYERTQRAYDLARDTGGGYVENRGLRQNSSIVSQALTVEWIKSDQGEFKGYQCLRQDIPQKHELDRDALIEAINCAASGLLMIDAEGQIQFANRAVENLFGYARAELLQWKIGALLPECLRAWASEVRGELLASNATKSMDGRHLAGRRKDGAEIPLELKVNRIEGSDRELVLITIIDSADRVQHERELERAKEAAEAANRAKSDFLARMSHEIRTPMSLIIGMNTLLLDSSLTSKQRQHVEIAQRNGRRLLRLVNGILDLSKVEAGKLELAAEQFDLNEILEECAATISGAIDEKGLEFEILTDLNTGRYWIGDPERLQQILLNLIGNAIKFTTKGRIEVRIRPETGAKGERGLRFEVADTGCGVSEDKIELIFEGLQRTPGAMDTADEGTGLGLPIAKTLVGKMGGQLWLEEKAGPGAKFVFTVFPQPTTKEGSTRKTAVAASARPPQTVPVGTRVLLVEDSPENAILMRAYLDNLALSLELAGNGVEAVAKRQQRDYDLILMDIQMPVMDGYTATREIRSWEKAQGRRRVPVVALTAHAANEAGPESSAAGCDGHLTKPVERKDLVETIAKFAQPQWTPDEHVPAVIQAPHPTFLPNCWLDLRKMREALGALDFSVLQRIGHDCASGAARSGFPEIANSGRVIEALAQALDVEGLGDAIERFGNTLLAASNAGARWVAAGFELPKQ